MNFRTIHSPRSFSSTLPGVYPRQMPTELLEKPRWVALRSNFREKRNEPVDWSGRVMTQEIEVTTAENANAIAETYRCKLGFRILPSMLQKELISIRLFHPFDPENGRLLPWARPIVEDLMTETYWQRFGRGRGIEFLIRGQIDLEHERYVFESSHARIEVLQGERFVVMTGDNDFTVPIRNRQAQLDNLKRFLTSNPCLLCGRPWCLGHEPWEKLGRSPVSAFERTHSLMKRVAHELDQIRPNSWYRLDPITLWPQAIAKTVESGLKIEVQCILLVSWSQRHGIPQPETPILELIESFKARNTRSLNILRNYR